MGKIALIIGVGGFVGPYLEQELSVNGYSVFGCGILSEELERRNNYYSTDITQYDEILNVFESLKPDVVFNLAAVSSVGLSWKKPQMTINVNVIGTVNILEAAAKVCPDAKIVLIGSSEEYAPSDKPVSENSPLDPVNPYGITRLAIEEFAKVYRGEHKLNITCVRAFNHTGLGQTDTFVLPSFIDQAALITLSQKAGKIRVGNLEAYRDFSDVRDVVKAYRLIAECEQELKVVNVGSGQAHQLHQLLEYIVSLSDQKIEIEIDPERFRPADLPYCCCDNTLLKNATGWAPEHDIFSTLQAMYEAALIR